MVEFWYILHEMSVIVHMPVQDFATSLVRNIVIRNVFMHIVINILKIYSCVPFLVGAEGRPRDGYYTLWVAMP